MAKKPFSPQIVSANDLFTGETIYLTASGWSAQIEDSVVAHDAHAAETLLSRGSAEPEIAVGPYLIDVEVAANAAPAPKKYRESIRISGPSVGALNKRPLEDARVAA